MAPTDQVQICHSSIFSPDTPHSIPKLSSLDAALNSPAEGPVLLSAKAPTMEDLNRLNIKLKEVQLSSAEASKDARLVAHNGPQDDVHSFVPYTPAGFVSRFRRDGGTSLFTNFQSFEDTSSDKAKNISFSTVDKMCATDKSVQELQSNEEPILIDLSDVVFQSFEDTSSNKAENMPSSTVGKGRSVFEKDGWERLYGPRCDDHIAVSDLPLLQRGRGVPLFLEVPLKWDANFRPFYDESSDDTNKTLSDTVDGKTHGSGDDDVKELPVFHRDGWDAMGDDPIDLALYMHYETCNGGLLKIKSRL